MNDALPELSPMPPAHPARRLLDGTGRAALWVGRALADGYRAVDPDLRMHVAQLPLMGLTALAGRASELVAQPDDGHRILVFVHGLGGQPGNFVGLRTWLRRSGRTRQYALALDAGPKPELEALGAQLAEQLREIIRVNERAADAPQIASEGSACATERNQIDGSACATERSEIKIDLVAHSMGGLVSRLALSEPDVAARVANLVTLGTPHHGTWIARYAATSLTRALRPASHTLQRLAEQLPWPGPPSMPRLSAFWSGADMLLLPHETGCVPGADNHEVVGASHFGYLLRPSAWRAVATALA